MLLLYSLAILTTCEDSAKLCHLILALGFAFPVIYSCQPIGGLDFEGN